MGAPNITASNANLLQHPMRKATGAICTINSTQYGICDSKSRCVLKVIIIVNNNNKEAAGFPPPSSFSFSR